VKIRKIKIFSSLYSGKCLDLAPPNQGRTLIYKSCQI